MTLIQEPTEVVPHIHIGIDNIKRKLGTSGIGKDQVNTQQKFKFRGIDDVLNALNIFLSEEHINVVPWSVSRKMIECGKTSNGNPVWKAEVEMEYRMYSAIDGSGIAVRMHGEGNDSADKATGKANSACYKQAMIQTFCIPTIGNPDADSDHQESARGAIKYVTTEEAVKIEKDAKKAGVEDMLLDFLSTLTDVQITSFDKIPYEFFDKAYEAINKGK